MANYKRQRYLFMTLDPVHIGTGGYRLGRVDNSIVREPGTKIPKIPGTSLHGAARSYAAQLYETPGAAGQSHDQIDNPDQNPVCYTFGYVQRSKNGQSNDQGKAYSGVVNIFDAHILFFPVHSMVGPVWVTTLERLEDAQFTVTTKRLEDAEFAVTTSTDWNSDQVLPNWDSNQALLNCERTDPLNLGWLMLGVAGEIKITPPKDSKWQDDKRYKAINRIVIVKDSLFSQIVNSNLEVRTSVAIDPETGAANEGALFTYEAIPRATFLTAEVVLDDYRQAFPSQKYLESRKEEVEKRLEQDITKKEKSDLTKNKAKIETSLNHIKQLKMEIAQDWKCPLCVVKSGFKLIEWLGVGGMGTRGFGRMAMVGKPMNVESQEIFNQSQSNQQNSSESSSETTDTSVGC